MVRDGFHDYITMVRDGFHDYITDTYLRRAYIEALRFQEGYREYDKLLAHKSYAGTFNLNKKKSSEEPEIISLNSRESSL